MAGSSNEVSAAFRAVWEKALDLNGRSRDLAVALLERIRKKDTLDFTLPDGELDNLLRGEIPASFFDFFRSGSDEGQALEGLIGSEQAALAKALWDDCPRHPLPYYNHWRPGSSFFAQWHSSPQTPGLEYFIRRPPYRASADSGLYYRPALGLLLSFLEQAVFGFELFSYLEESGHKTEIIPPEEKGKNFSLEEFLFMPGMGEGRPLFVDEGDFVPRLIALTLDGGGTKADSLMNLLRSLLAEAAALSTLAARQIISGLLKSGRAEAINLAVGRLDNFAVKKSAFLRPSELEDYLGQTVAELASLASLPAFLRVVEVIIEKELTRVPSVAKAVISWLGLDENVYMWADLDDLSFPVIDQERAESVISELGLSADSLEWTGEGEDKLLCFNPFAGEDKAAWIRTALLLIRRYLSDEGSAGNGLADENPLNAMLALWAIAAVSLEKAENLCQNLLRAEARHLKLAGVAFAVSVSSRPRRFALLRPLLDDPAFTSDRELCAWILSGLPLNVFEQSWRQREGLPYENLFKLSLENRAASKPWPPDFIFLSDGDLAAYYFCLRKILDEFPAMETSISVSDSFLPGLPMSYSRPGLIDLMIQPLVRAMVQTRPGFKPRRTFPGYRYLPRGHPIERFKARWRLKYKIINTELLRPVSDHLDWYIVAEGGRRLHLRDLFCSSYAGLWIYLTSSAEDLMIMNLIQPPSTPVRRAAISGALAGRLNFSLTLSLFLRTDYPDEELPGLEDILKIKADPPRKAVMMKLLMSLESRPEELSALIARLKSDADPLKRKGAEELLAIIRRRRDVDAFRKIYEYFRTE